MASDRQLTFQDLEYLADWLSEQDDVQHMKAPEPEENGPEDDGPATTEKSPIERVITGFLEHCEQAGTIPTRDQAEAIYLLDLVLSKYND